MDTKALFKLSYGVYLLSTAWEGKDNGCIINTACQVTSAPPRVSVTVNKDNLTCRMIQQSGVFAVHALSENAHLEFIGRYGFRSGTDTVKFAGMDVTRGGNGAPLLLDAAEVTAALSCRVVGSLDVGTHVIFVGEVTDAVDTGFGRPLTYADYHAVKRGATPPKAPGFVQETPPTDAPRWRCKVCGYVHEGDTPPERCPVCGKDASFFEKI